MSWIGLCIQAVLVGLAVILLVFRYRFRYNLPPGPFALPIIGNVQLLKTGDWQAKWREYKHKYGPVFQIHLGMRTIVILNDIHVAMEALVTKGADFANRSPQPSHLILSQGGKDIGFADHTPLWQLQKQIAVTAIRQYMTGHLYEKALHRSLRLVLDHMASQKEEFNPEPFVNWLIFDINHSMCFNESREMNHPIVLQYTKLEQAIDSQLGNGLIEDRFPFLMKMFRTKRLRNYEEAVMDLVNLVAEKYKSHQNSFNADNLTDLTDVLILTKQQATKEEPSELTAQLTETHMIQTLMDILRVGSAVSRIGLHYALRFMASYPDVQEKCQEEIDRVVKKGLMPGIHDRQNLPYCKATLREILRLGTIIPLGLPHSTVCNTTVGGYDIPKNTTVVINQWEIHRDPKFWSNPESFNPERYLDNTGQIEDKPESWIPFCTGPRVCVGKSISKTGLLIMLTSILQRFKISLAPDTNKTIDFNQSLWLVVPKDYKIMVSERKA